MKHNLKRIVLCAALAGLPFISALAHDWSPVGSDATLANRCYWATHGGVYSGRDVIDSFTATVVDSTLNISGEVADGTPVPLKVNGTVILDASTTDMTVTVTGDVEICPYFAPPAGRDTPAEEFASQIVFDTGIDPDALHTITVNVDNNLTFTGRTTSNETDGFKDLLVTFKGNGVTKFILADGTAVWFTGQIDYTEPQEASVEGVFPPITAISKNAGGTKVFVLMDQKPDEVAAGWDKLIFQRKLEETKRAFTPSSTDYQRVLIGVGPNSLFTYLSTNDTGLQADDDYSNASIAFDVSNTGSGRMILQIEGAYELGTNPQSEDYECVSIKYPFNDGAFIVAGHYVEDFDPDVIAGDGYEYTEPGYDFTMPAGVNARVRVLDNQFYDDAEQPYTAPATNTRGLMVINKVQSHGKLALDTYWDLYLGDGYLSYDWAYSNAVNQFINVRFGCIIGVNGQMDVFHNTFVDYVAGALGCKDGVEEGDIESYGTDPDTLLKKRNPSALIIDGLDVDLFVDGNPTKLVDYEPQISPFVAADPYTQNVPVKGTVRLLGNGKLFMRAAASDFYGHMYNLYKEYEVMAEKYFDYTWLMNLDGPSDVYNGWQLDPSENYDVKYIGEGEHVLDVEGELDARSEAANTAYEMGDQRNYAALIPYIVAGVINAETLLLSHLGTEVLWSDLVGDYVDVTRPLDMETSYDRTNSAVLFFNNVAGLTNVTLRHNSVADYVDGLARNNGSEPAITGAERFNFSSKWWGTDTDSLQADPNRYRLPEIQFYSANLEVWESLNASGVRFVTKDVWGTAGTAGSTNSTVKFYDKGFDLDTNVTGFGRIFLNGSYYNQTADGNPNPIMSSCQWNIFKQNASDARNYDPIKAPTHNYGTSATIKMSLQNGDYPDVTPELTPEQRSQHLFLFAQYNDSTAANSGAVCNLAVGWPGDTVADVYQKAGTNCPAGDASGFPYSLPYPEGPTLAEPLVDNPDYFTSDPFALDALAPDTTTTNTGPVPAANLEIAGYIIGFGSFDENGNSITIPAGPLADNDHVQGIVYVKHGGKISVTRPLASLVTVPGPRELTSIPYQSTFDTMLCQKIWNDYTQDGSERRVWLSGIVEFKQDQVLYGHDMGLQPYNFTSEMFNARTDTDGYVRLSAYNAGTNNGVNYNLYNLPRDRSGYGDMTIGWAYREPVLYTPMKSLETRKPADLAATKIHVRVPAKLVSRATESINEEQEKPATLLYIGPGDHVVQMKVAGATMEDPFVLDVTGDETNPTPARVDEFVSLKTTRDMDTDRYIAEGDHARLFVEYGGRMGLGDKDWNEHSLDAWSRLGKDFVQLRPLGNGIVIVNSDLLIADRLAMLPCYWNRGTEETPEWLGFGYSGVNRLTFFSEEERVIRIPAGGELDLSAFGQAPYRQEIAFAGKVKLVIEEGATIRFPDSDYVDGGVVLYFNDESECIFEGAGDPATFLPYNLQSPIANARCKIIGEGQIWLNKNAHMRINGNVFVGVESDDLTPHTDVTVSIQRQGRWDIGDANVSGGAFQVGNPVDRNPVAMGVPTRTETHSVAFNVILNGPRATWHIDREGFVGFGAGILNKNGAPNGTATGNNNPVMDPDYPGYAATTPITWMGETLYVPVMNPDTTKANGTWQVQALFNVDYIWIQNIQGVWEHSNIFDGSTNNASVLAIGPSQAYYLSCNGIGNAIIRGGGNVINVDETATVLDPVWVNIWDYAGPNKNSATSDVVWWNGVMASAPLMLDQANTLGSTYVQRFGANGYEFDFTIFGTGETPAYDMYDLLSYVPFAEQSWPKIDVATTQFLSLATFINHGIYDVNGDYVNGNKYDYCDFADQITRFNAPAQIAGMGTLADALNIGVLGATRTTQGAPSNYTIIQ